MIRKFDEEFPDLIVFDDQPSRVLHGIDGDDDVVYPEQIISNSFLFLLSQKKGGFLENYCLRENNKAKLNNIRNNMDKNPDLLMNVVLVLDKILPINYEEFSKLNIFEQSQLLEKTRISLKDEDLELFNKVFDDLTHKYKTKELKPNEIKS